MIEYIWFKLCLIELFLYKRLSFNFYVQHSFLFWLLLFIVSVFSLVKHFITFLWKVLAKLKKKRKINKLNSWERTENKIGSDSAQALFPVKDSTPVFSSRSSELAASVTDCQTEQLTAECFICQLVAQCVISGGMSFLFVAGRFNPLLAQRLVPSLFCALRVHPQLFSFIPNHHPWGNLWCWKC